MSFKLIERGYFNPGLFNPRLFNPGLFNHELSNPGFFSNPHPRLPWSPWYPAPPEVGLFAFLWVDFVLYITGAFAKKKTNLGPNL